MMPRTTLLFVPLIFGLTILMGVVSFTSKARSALAATHPMAESPATLEDAIDMALNFVAAQQGPDGGIDAFGSGSSNESGTARAVLAVAAAGKSVETIQSGGLTMLDYLSTKAITYTHDASGTTSAHLFPANAGLLLAAAAAANQDVTAFGGMDLISQLEATYHAGTGAYSTTARLGFSSGAASDINQAWSIFGLSAAARPVPPGAINYLVSNQAPDGSWGFSDPDTTAVAVVALIASGQVAPTEAPVQNALAYFAATQLENGGWRPSWDTDPLNADSTGWIMQALAVSGFSPVTESWARPGGNPRSALLSLQAPDGSIGGTFVNAYSTIEAIFGLTEAPLFFLGQEVRMRRALSWIDESQLVDGSWAGFPGNQGSTADAALAYASAGFDPALITAQGSSASAMDYLASQAVTFTASSPDNAGKLAVAVAAAGLDPNSFGGVDIPNVLTSTHYSATLGGFGIITNTWHQAFAMLGLAAAGEPVPVTATSTLTGLQQADGGWKYDLSGAPWNTTSADSTGLALQALVAAGMSPSANIIQEGLAFLRNSQDSQGGWENANSTAYAIQGLYATGEDLADWTQAGATPLEALVGYQKVDGPSVWAWSWSPDNGLATWQSVPALMGVSYPYTPSALGSFTPTLRGPDPDRLVIRDPSAGQKTGFDLVIPFGSDLDADGSLALAYRVAGDPTWLTGTSATRMDGFFLASLPVTRPVEYEVQVQVTDTTAIQ